MIHYSLVCDKSHKFDGWFSNAAAYDGQKLRGLAGVARPQARGMAHACAVGEGRAAGTGAEHREVHRGAPA